MLDRAIETVDSMRSSVIDANSGIGGGRSHAAPRVMPARQRAVAEADSRRNRIQRRFQLSYQRIGFYRLAGSERHYLCCQPHAPMGGMEGAGARNRSVAARKGRKLLMANAIGDATLRGILDAVGGPENITGLDALRDALASQPQGR